MVPTNEFSRPVVIEPWPEGGITVTLSADPAERRALARRFDLLELTALAAHGRLERGGVARELRFRGWLEAAVVQACVVSLEPVVATIREPIERRYRRVDGPSMPASPPDLWLVGEDEVEPVSGRAIDLGAAVAEELGVALDPYPRAADPYALVSQCLGPNITFGVAEPPETPFAALTQRDETVFAALTQRDETELAALAQLKKKRAR